MAAPKLALPPQRMSIRHAQEERQSDPAVSGHWSQAYPGPDGIPARAMWSCCQEKTRLLRVLWCEIRGFENGECPHSIVGVVIRTVLW